MKEFNPTSTERVRPIGQGPVLTQASIERAGPVDLEDLLNLYFSIYGKDYPLRLGVDREASLEALQDPENYYWIIARDLETKQIVGSLIVEQDFTYKIGRIAGMVVRKEYQGQQIAARLLAQAKSHVLYGAGKINSLYATTRTLSVAPQRVFLRLGFIPLGLFPNAHKIETYETLTLFGHFAPGVLEKRRPYKLSPSLRPIFEVLAQKLPVSSPECEFRSEPLSTESVSLALTSTSQFEFVFAPKFVHNRFNEIFKDDLDAHFYPFHRPNLLVVSEDMKTELYFYYGPKDRYCVLMACNRPIITLGQELKKVLFQMRDYGASYIEVLVRADISQTIDYLLQNQFLPSAVYPAMREISGAMYDYVILTQTMEPLDFNGMAIHRSFGPYTDQYVDLWIKMHLKTLEVFNE